MAPLIVLFVSLLLFRALGAAGIGIFSSWLEATRYAFSLMLFFTASAHFTTMKEDLVRMVPPWMPRPRAMVYFTGICEIAGAIGLLVPSLRQAAGLALIVFFICVLPANIHAARSQVTLRGRPATALWLRIPMQVLFVGLAWWCSR